MAWLSNGPIVNPGAGAVLAETGPVPAQGIPGRSLPGLIASSTVAATLRIEHRNAANAANLQSQVLPVQANTPLAIPALGSVSPDPGERIRLVVVSAVVGTVQGSLFT